MVMDRTCDLPRSNEAPALARQFVADVCASRGLNGSRVHDAQLMVSETVTNALMHGQGTITLRLEHEGADGVRVNVHDQGTGMRAPDVDAAVEHESGRGFMIVDALAARWGIDRTSGGTCVWFALV